MDGAHRIARQACRLPLRVVAAWPRLAGAPGHGGDECAVACLDRANARRLTALNSGSDLGSSQNVCFGRGCVNARAWNSWNGTPLIERFTHLTANAKRRDW